MNRFAETFGLCGAAFGVLIALAMSVPGHLAWYDAALTFLLSAAAFSGALAFVGWAFTRLIPANWLSRIVLFAILEVIAVVASVAIVLGMRELPHGRFTPLPGPPEPPVAFEGVRGISSRRTDHRPRREIVVRTAAAHRFELRADSSTHLPWKRLADQPQALDSIDPVHGGDSIWYYRAPVKLGHQLSSFAVRDVAVECSWEAHYLLMADHSLWFWEDGGCGYGGLATLFVAAVLAVLLAIVAYRIAVRDWAHVTIR